MPATRGTKRAWPGRAWGSLAPETGGACRAAGPDPAEALGLPQGHRTNPQETRPPRSTGSTHTRFPDANLPSPLSHAAHRQKGRTLGPPTPRPPLPLGLGPLAVGHSAAVPAVMEAVSPRVSCSGFCSCHHVPLPHRASGVTGIKMSNLCLTAAPTLRARGDDRARLLPGGPGLRVQVSLLTLEAHTPMRLSQGQRGGHPSCPPPTRGLMALCIHNTPASLPGADGTPRRAHRLHPTRTPLSGQAVTRAPW